MQERVEFKLENLKFKLERIKPELDDLHNVSDRINQDIKLLEELLGEDKVELIE